MSADLEKWESVKHVDLNADLTKRKHIKNTDGQFSNRDLSAIIIPLFLEQLLVMLVGLADTLIVSYAGESAVSGVSLKDSVTKNSCQPFA